MKSTPQTRQELAHAYGISHRTLDRWLKRAGIQLTPGLLTPKELQLIYDTFGTPPRDSLSKGKGYTSENQGR